MTAGTAETTASAGVEEAIAECARIVAERRYSRHPFVAELDRMQPDMAAFGRWGVQKYHQVYLQNVIFSAIHSNAQEHEDVRQYAMDQLIAEETGLFSGDASHYVLMRRFAEACGAPAESFDRSAASPQVREYVDTLVSLCRDNPVAIGLLVIHSIESQSGEAAGRLKTWLAANRGFAEPALEWFTVHAEDEDEHAAAGLALVRRHADEVSEFATVATGAADEITKAWLRLQDHYLDLLTAS